MNDWFVELYLEEMKKLGFERIAVGPGPLKARARKKATARGDRAPARRPAGKKPVARRKSAARRRPRATSRAP